jgi:hypothetical protein
MHERRLLDSFAEALRGHESRPHFIGGPEMQGYENTWRLALMIFYKTLPCPSLPIIC